MYNLHQTLRSICDTPDGSWQQKRLFNPLLAYSANVLKYQVRLYGNGSDVLSLTLMALCGIERKNNTSATTIRNFLATLPASLKENECRDRFRSLLMCIFNRKRVDLLRKEKPNLICSLDRVLNEENSSCFLDFLSYEDISLIDQEEEFLRQSLWRYLAEDPERILTNCYPKDYPQANLKIIIQKRYLFQPQESWEKLSHLLQCPQGTITAHFHRKGKPLLRTIVGSFLNYSQVS